MGSHLLRSTLAIVTLALSLVTLPASADGLNTIAYDPLDDVIDIDTNETVDQPGIDILNVRVLDLSGDLEVSMLVNGSINEDASFTVNLLADGEDLFTFIMTSGSFDASDPDGLPVTVTGWTDEGRVIWEVATDLLGIQTGLEIDSAYTTYTTPGSQVHYDSLEGEVTQNDPPTVAITWPTEGLEVSGTIDVTGTASDDTAVVGVVVRVDGGDWSQADGTEGWTYRIDTTNLSDGDHLVEVRSYDVELQSAIMNVTIDVANGGGANEPPSLTITFPVGAKPLDGTVDITGTASDDTAVVRVDVRIDGGTWQVAVGTTSWTLQVDTTTLTDGHHTIEAVAFDEGELWSPTVTGDLYVANDPPSGNEPPVVTITSPHDGSVVTRTWITQSEVFGTWSDDTATDLVVRYRLDGGDWEMATSITDEWMADVDFMTLPPEGTHTLEVIGFDGVHNSSIALVEFTFQPNIPPTISGRLDPQQNEEDRMNPVFKGLVGDQDSLTVVVEVSVDNETWIFVEEVEITPSSAWSYTFNISAQPEGMNLFYARAFDGIDYSETVEIAYNRPDKKGGVKPKPFPGPDVAMSLLALSLVSAFVTKVSQRGGARRR